MAVRAKVEGVVALRKKLAELATVADSDSRSRVSLELTRDTDNVAKFARDTIRAAATGLGWPKRTIRTIFKYSDLKADELPRSVRSSLVGVRKGAPPRLDREIYKEWRAGESKNPKANRGKGELLGMSLAAMFEFGTSKIQARPAFRRTYEAMKSTLRRDLVNVYRKAVESFNR